MQHPKYLPFSISGYKTDALTGFDTNWYKASKIHDVNIINVSIVIFAVYLIIYLIFRYYVMIFLLRIKFLKQANFEWREARTNLKILNIKYKSQLPMPFCTILSPAIIVGITLSYIHIIYNEDYDYWFYITVEMTADYKQTTVNVTHKRVYAIVSLYLLN